MDIAMDLRPGSSTYGDVLIVNGDIVATSDADARGTNFVLQSIIQRLSTFRGEWFMDNSIGTPYFQQLLVKGTTVEQAELALSDIILGTPGVLSVISIQAAYNSAARNVAVTFVATSTAGPISYSGPVGYAVAQGTST